MGVMEKFKSFIGVPDDEFYDEEDPEEVEPVQEKKKDSRFGKGDSWDDIEFL